MDDENTGDQCAPPPHDKVDVCRASQLQTNCVVGGGGILVFPGVVDRITQACIEQNKEAIVWGIGVNDPDVSSPPTYPKSFQKLSHVGVRDWGVGLRWVPCASCISPLFDRQYEITKEVAFYSHYLDRSQKSIEI